MTAVPESLQLLHRGNDAGAQGIEVDIADELQEIGFLLAKDGLVTVLEQVAGPFVAPVVPDSVGCQKATHHLCKRRLSRPEEEMKVVRDEGKGVADRLRFVEDSAKAVEKKISVIIIAKDDPPLDTSRNDVMQRTSGIHAGFAGHVRRTPRGCLTGGVSKKLRTGVTNSGHTWFSRATLPRAPIDMIVSSRHLWPGCRRQPYSRHHACRPRSLSHFDCRTQLSDSSSQPSLPPTVRLSIMHITSVHEKRRR